MAEMQWPGGYLYREPGLFGFMVRRGVDDTWPDTVRAAIRGYRRHFKKQPGRLLCHDDDLKAVTAAASRFKPKVEVGPVKGRGFIWSVGND